jgi:hypothetical protein
MAAEVLAGLGALKSAFDIAKSLKDIDDAARRNGAVIELQEKILGAQSAQAQLIESVSALEKEMAHLKAWNTDKERYKLTELRPGVTAYSLKEGMENGEPPHHLCASCYQGHHKTILQAATWQPGRCHVLICHDCGWYVYLSGNADPAHKAYFPKPYRGP